MPALVGHVLGACGALVTGPGEHLVHALTLGLTLRGEVERSRRRRFSELVGIVLVRSPDILPQAARAFAEGLPLALDSGPALFGSRISGSQRREEIGRCGDRSSCKN